MPTHISNFIRAALGPVELVADHSWPHGRARVRQVIDGNGGHWIVKEHSVEEEYRCEVFAYERWVPALREGAPTLFATNDTHLTLIVSAFSVEPFEWTELAIQREAGAQLRRLHNSEALPMWHDFADEKRAVFDKWASRASALLPARVVHFVRSEVGSLEGIRPPRVPCHLDFTPRNWLMSSGFLRVIDFEEAQGDVWVNDLGRLYFGWWKGRKDLEEAFLDGYGRSPDDVEHMLMAKCFALTAMWHVVHAHEHGNAPLEDASRDILDGLMSRANPR